jgi:hypothetical protein
MAEQCNPLRGTRFPAIVTSARGRHGNPVDENLWRGRNTNPNCVNSNKLIGV